MARRRRPPEARRLTYRAATLWELCAALDILPYRQVSVWAGLGDARELRDIRRERAMLEATRLCYAPPRPARGGRPARPHLYITTARGGHLRIHADTARIERWRYGRAYPGAPGGWRWEPGPPRGARWADLIAVGLAVRAARLAREACPAGQLALWP